MCDCGSSMSVDVSIGVNMGTFRCVAVAEDHLIPMDDNQTDASGSAPSPSYIERLCRMHGDSAVKASCCAFCSGCGSGRAERLGDHAIGMFPVASVIAPLSLCYRPTDCPLALF